MAKRTAKMTPSRAAGRTVTTSGVVTGAQLRAARAFLKLSQRQLSSLSKVSNLTIVRMEATDGAVTRRARLVASIIAALSSKGIRFLRSNGFSEGILFIRRRRRRA